MNLNITKVIFFLFLLPVCVIGQKPNVLVKGKINNNLARYVELQVNQKYLNDATDFYKSNILEDGSFMFAVEVNEPQLVKIIYARNEAVIYLEPNDSLIIEAEANSFQYSLKFSGKSGANNRFYQEYLKINPPILNPWQLVQYQKGIFWFANEQVVDNQMQRLGEEQFTQVINDKKEQALSKLLRYQTQGGEALSPRFIKYLETEIFFDWAYHMLLYGSVYSNMHRLDEASFFKFMEDIPLQGKSLGSYWYRNYLLAHINYLSIKQNTDDDEYVHQYQLAENIFDGKELAFVRAHLLYKGFYAKRANKIIPYYLQFLEQNTYQIFDEKITGAYEKAMRYAIGAPAPDFQITDMNGQSVSLLDYQGKVVLLNFWASWCRPCIRKMYQYELVQENLESNDIVFLNVSLDRDAASWENSINTNGFKGVHAIASGALESEISELYEVKALPRYFIIDKRGNFAEKPRTKDLQDLELTLMYLNRRK